MSEDFIRVVRYRFPVGRKGGEGRVVQVHAGISTTKRVIPAAGEEYAFTHTLYPVNVDVYVSPTGRSVQVHVNGERVR